jgi:endonuclease/exonuclease/phosphatase family metal-dependent hydrolase
MGSAVVSFRSDLLLRARPRLPLADCYLDPVTGDALPESHRGACAVADVLDGEGHLQITAISLYGQWEVLPDGAMEASARVHRILSDLTGVLVQSRRRAVVLAGDFNLSTQHTGSRQSRAAADVADVVFARLRGWGLTDCAAHTRASRTRLDGCTCREGGDCAHVQTFRSGNRLDSAPTQLDYAFASQSLVSKLAACEVVHDDAPWTLSDHCPIVLEFK